MLFLFASRRITPSEVVKCFSAGEDYWNISVKTTAANLLPGG